MFHPNVFSDGSLCLDIIQDLWKPIYTVDMLLTSIQSLLTDPNTSSPANPEAARLLITDPKKYKRTVRRIAQQTVES
jgi:ubiquitin-conjugating enzyme E2 A